MNTGVQGRVKRGSKRVQKVFKKWSPGARVSGGSPGGRQEVSEGVKKGSPGGHWYTFIRPDYTLTFN